MFDSIPEDQEQSFECERCGGSIRLNDVTGEWECDDCEAEQGGS